MQISPLEGKPIKHEAEKTPESIGDVPVKLIEEYMASAVFQEVGTVGMEEYFRRRSLNINFNQVKVIKNYIEKVSLDAIVKEIKKLIEGKKAIGITKAVKQVRSEHPELFQHLKIEEYKGKRKGSLVGTKTLDEITEYYVKGTENINEEEIRDTLIATGLRYGWFESKK